MHLQPKFMDNEEWYKLNEDLETMDEFGYILTDKAPKEAVDSYNEFYGIGKEDGDMVTD